MGEFMRMVELAQMGINPSEDTTRWRIEENKLNLYIFTKAQVESMPGIPEHLLPSETVPLVNEEKERATYRIKLGRLFRGDQYIDFASNAFKVNFVVHDEALGTGFEPGFNYISIDPRDIGPCDAFRGGIK